MCIIVSAWLFIIMSSLFLCSICHSVSVICECIQVTVLSVCMSVCHGWWALMHYWMSHVSLFVVYQLDLLSLNEWAVISLTLILVCHPIMSFVCIHVLIVYSSRALWGWPLPVLLLDTPCHALWNITLTVNLFKAIGGTRWSIFLLIIKQLLKEF